MVSGTRCPYVSVCGCEVVRGALAPKGPMTYAVFIWASRMELGPGGWNWGLCSPSLILTTTIYYRLTDRNPQNIRRNLLDFLNETKS